MLNLKGNLWYFHNWGYWIVIPTNGFVKNDGSAVMGAGLAKQALKRFPGIDKKVGQAIKKLGNRPVAFGNQRLITFPVKHHWAQEADIELIRTSAELLVELVDKHELDAPYYLPRVGCGNGKKIWDTEVYPVLKGTLDDRFVVVELE